MGPCSKIGIYMYSFHHINFLLKDIERMTVSQFYTTDVLSLIYAEFVSASKNKRGERTTLNIAIPLRTLAF